MKASIPSRYQITMHLIIQIANHFYILMQYTNKVIPKSTKSCHSLSTTLFTDVQILLASVN